MTFWWHRGKRAEWGRGRPTRRLAACHPVSATPLHLPHETPARLLPCGFRPRPRGPGYVCPVVGGRLRPVSPDSGSGELFKHGRAGPTPGRQTVARVHPRKGRPSSCPCGAGRGARGIPGLALRPRGTRPLGRGGRRSLSLCRGRVGFPLTRAG